MAIISGKQTILGFASTATWGTEVQAATLLAFDTFDPGISHTTIESSSTNGLNQVMLDDMERGATTYRPSITMKMRSNAKWEYLLAQIMGTSAAPTEVTGGQADYKHTITVNTSANPKYFSLAWLSSSATVLAFPSIAVTKATLTIPNPPGVATWRFDMIADSILRSTSTTSVAELQALTAPATAPLIVDQDDEFLVNAASGAGLSSGTDCVSVRALTFTIERPQDSLAEIKCATGNASPTDNGLINATLDVTAKGLEDHTVLAAGDAGDVKKLSVYIDSETQIGSGTVHSFKLFVPRAKIIQEPTYPITSPGFNPLSYQYQCLKASANPTGMTSTYPYFEIVNTTSTSLLA